MYLDAIAVDLLKHVSALSLHAHILPISYGYSLLGHSRVLDSIA